MILVVGSKGGVGATALTVGLASAANANTWPVDLTGTGDPLFVLDGRQIISLDVIARLSGHDLERALDLASIHRRPAFVLSQTSRVLYAQHIAHILDVMESHATIVADMGVQPLPAVTELATHIVLVLTPDPRSLRRAERFAMQNANSNIIPVLNFARSGERIAGQDEIVVLPDAGRADPLRDEQWHTALLPLAEQLGLSTKSLPQVSGRAPRRTARPSFDFRSLIPRVKWVE